MNWFKEQDSMRSWTKENGESGLEMRIAKHSLKLTLLVMHYCMCMTDKGIMWSWHAVLLLRESVKN